MSNPANHAHIIGRLAQDIKSFPNADGSRKQLITIAVDDNFRSGAEKSIATNFIQLENFVPAGRNAGGWDRVHNGDLIAVDYRVDAKPYTDGKGETHYPQKLVVDGFPTFLEPKSVTEARAAKKAVATAPEVPAPIAETETEANSRIAQLEAELAAVRGAQNAAVPVAAGAIDYENQSPFGS